MRVLEGVRAKRFLAVAAVIALGACQKEETAQQAFCRGWAMNPSIPVPGKISVDEVQEISFDQWRQRRIAFLKKALPTEPEKTVMDFIDQDTRRETEFRIQLNYLAMKVRHEAPSGVSRTKAYVCVSGPGYCSCHSDGPDWERPPQRAFNAPIRMEKPDTNP
jgi:hypothetical protein